MENGGVNTLCQAVQARNQRSKIIPKAFIEHRSIGQVLHLTIDEFNFEERTVIYLYYFAHLPIDKITDITKLSTPYVVSTLVMYCEKLALKTDIFKKAVPYDDADLISIGEMLELECWEEIQLANTCIVS